MKIPLALAGIEPATFRFVAQRLNHYATAVPIYIYIYIVVGTTVTIKYEILYVPNVKVHMSLKSMYKL